MIAVYNRLRVCTLACHVNQAWR